MQANPHSLAAKLNRSCHCQGANVPALQQRIAGQIGVERPFAESHPHLFSAVPFFLSDEHGRQMQSIIATVESVVALPRYQALVLSSAPAIAQHAPANKGVFIGYDFHVTEDGPKLIEINTNAGGALLNVQLLGEQLVCCPQARQFSAYASQDAAAARLVSMFHEEWRLARGPKPLRRIVIVDETPEQQYLYPELVLFKQLFEKSGLETRIVNPTELSFDGLQLTHNGDAIDLVYNRLTDFYFEKATHAALRDAYLRDAVVVTPHPRSHALYANKRNLATLSDETTLRELGASADGIATLLNGVPRTEEVIAADADRWWSQRKRWFFKPMNGYGSRGVYRGDKITRSVFNDLLGRRYIAQQTVQPSERNYGPDEPHALKVDVRNYVYDGEVQLVAARLYRGQTTNFRTPAGGFAPVFFASAERLAQAV